MSYLGPKTRNLDPVINYISNGRAYNSTEGWNTYQNGYFAPTTGTGGSPASFVLWQRSTTSPLRQGADFNIISNESGPGYGVSYDFTIDNADLAKVLSITFDYEFLDGNYFTGDLAVYIIQDPNGTPVVIQPAGYQVQSATIGTKMKHVATFQTASNVTSYRLCLHIADLNENFSDFSLGIDNVSVGPQVVQYGAPVTDWVSYTPTGSWVTNTTYTGYWRRVGDSIEVRARVLTSGAPTVAALTVGIPSGLSIDTTKANNIISSLGSLGIATINDAGVTTLTGVVQYQSVTSVGVFVNNAAGTYTVEAGVTHTVPFTFGANDKVDIFFAVPILGWSSTVQMSNDTDTRVVAFSARDSSSQTLTTANTASQWNTIILDTHNAFNSGTNEYVVAVPGVYAISAGQTVTGTTDLYLSLAVNGAQVGAGAFNSRRSDLKVTANLKAGDRVTISMSVVSGTQNRVPNYGYFNVERLSGPSAIAASETVAASYWLPTNQSASPTAPINFSSKQFDSHGAVTTGAGWKFTAPVSGKYSISTMSYVSGANNAAFLYKNGSIFVQMAEAQANSVSIGTVVIDLIAGDYIDIRPLSTQTIIGGTFATAAVAKIFITRLGN